MKSISEFKNLYIHRDPVDMRKGINGLSGIVEQDMKLDLKSSALFIFCNGRRTRMKILYFDRSGFAIWLKKLEGSKFSWPLKLDKETVPIEASDMELLLEGINVWTRFEDVHFNQII
jgi:transposase